MAFLPSVSNPLTKNSRGTCALGLPMCISFSMSGQITKPSMSVSEIASPAHQSEMNPLSVVKTTDILGDFRSEPFLNDFYEKFKDELSVDKVNPNVRERLRIGGMTEDEDVCKLIAACRICCYHGNCKPATPPTKDRKLSDSEKEHIDSIRMLVLKISEICFPVPKKGEEVTKILSSQDFKKYQLESDPTKAKMIGGCIGKADEYSESDHSLKKLCVDYGLDYPNSQFTKEGEEAPKTYVIIKTKIGKASSKQVTKPLYAMVDPDYPQTKHGLLGNPETEKLTPEYHCGIKRIPLTKGATAVEYDVDGNVVAEYEYVVDIDEETNETTYWWDRK